jgi:hypothetical protein
MSTRRRASFVLASISAVALLAPAVSASAQSYDQAPPPGYDQNQPPPQGDDQGPPPGYDQNQPPPQGYDQGPPPGYDQNQPPPQGYDQGPPPQGGQYGPPQGQYAPPPPEGAYDERTQAYDRDYAARYSAWAAQNCIDRRNNNTAAGAIIGGVLGAVIGGNIAGRGEHFGGAVVGGALGATAGAAIGSSSTDTRGCPPGYYIRAGAPGFYYTGPYVGVAPVYAPGWYNPWFWDGGHYIYRPYRSWYWRHPAYWRGRVYRRRY